MFKCYRCGEQQLPGVGQHKIVVKTRIIEYKDGNDNVIGRGSEIVQEVAMCPNCAGKETIDEETKESEQRTTRVVHRANVEKVRSRDEGGMF